jgi:hypothetical protein
LLRARRITFPPFRATAFAVASPIPLDAPVTNTDLPAIFMVRSFHALIKGVMMSVITRFRP